MARSLSLLVILTFLAAACSGSTGTTTENYPDAQTRALAARARERRPVEDSALPPRHLEPERHPESLVDRFLIVSGGPPPDGIPSIDEPSFVSTDAVDWLAEEEPVAVLTIDDETRIYPTQILIWHEIVNDRINNKPITMTYCPLCNSVVAFEATSTGQDGDEVELDFGTSGALYRSALVMYDRQTESLWTHFDGQAVIGTMIGSQLKVLPAAMVSWADARDANPEAQVLDRPTGRLARPYGTVPYANYETAPPSSGFVTGVVDSRLEPKQRVVGINLDGELVAVDRRTLTESRVLVLETASSDLVLMWEPGTASALDGEAIADGLQVGSVGVFRSSVDGQELTFEADDIGSITDQQTGSTWSIRGQAVSGPLSGQRLAPVAHLDTFWFAWSGYYPDTDLFS